MCCSLMIFKASGLPTNTQCRTSKTPAREKCCVIIRSCELNQFIIKMLKVDGNCDNLQRSHVAEIFVPSKMLNFKIQEYYWSYIIEVSCKDFELKGLLYPYSLFCVKLVANPSKKKKKKKLCDLSRFTIRDI